MANQTTQQGVPLYTTAERINILEEQTKHLSAIRNSEIYKLTIVSNGTRGKEAVNKTLVFPPGSVPPEFQQFIQSYADRLYSELIALRAGIKLLRYNNRVVSLEDFIKDYTAGENPSLSEQDANELHDIAPGAILVISINNQSTQVQRIN